MILRNLFPFSLYQLNYRCLVIYNYAYEMETCCQLKKKISNNRLITPPKKTVADASRWNVLIHLKKFRLIITFTCRRFFKSVSWKWDEIKNWDQFKRLLNVRVLRSFLSGSRSVNIIVDSYIYSLIKSIFHSLSHLRNDSAFVFAS